MPISGEVEVVGAGDAAALTIGDLAEQTGVSAATLRVWETRYGFPVPHRRASGHRRYDERHVAAILDVVRRRAHGVRLDVAITQAQAAESPVSSLEESSVFSRLRHTHPELMPHRLRKSTLLSLSRDRGRGLLPLGSTADLWLVPARAPLPCLRGALARRCAHVVGHLCVCRL